MNTKWLSGLQRFFIFVILLCAYPLSAGAVTFVPIPANIHEQKYMVSPGDLLEIDVFEVKELTRTIRVRSNGFISLPLIGSINVQGLTERELELTLEGLLEEKYLHDPQVSIFVRESGFFYVLGMVENKEGIFPYRPGHYVTAGHSDGRGLPRRGSPG